MINKILGLGTLLAIPILMKRFRPIEKEIVKGAVKVGEHFREMAAITGEDFEDLMAEVRMEMNKTKS
ncbi:MAG TPA: DUF5132 domain-containing protein [Balneolales bacterium]|nr:DUF5132 domain-containing protein [Balneolales bacterium]